MTSETMGRLRSDTLALLRPPPMISTADWIEQNIYLPDSASALPGRIRLWSYQRGICDALDDPEIERVSVLKSARIGYTALIQGVIANYVANAPTLIMSLQPTSDDARRFAVDLEEVFDASPALRGMLTAEDSADRSTMYDRRFPGGSLKFVGARAPRNLRGHTVRILAMDEIDGYEMTDEGDPIALAETRTKTFGRNRKILAGSTPVFDTGPITRATSNQTGAFTKCRVRPAASSQRLSGVTFDGMPATPRPHTGSVRCQDAWWTNAKSPRWWRPAGGVRRHRR